MNPIGHVRSDTDDPPRHWSVSEVEGTFVIDEEYLDGIREIEPGQRIVVLFHFDKSPGFTHSKLRQTPPHLDHEVGVFSICSPVRPNPIGL
jgi:tRNA (adenine37-N6)-methyltransferase